MAKIGDKRERVRVVRYVRTQRSDGGFDTVQTTIATRWARVVPARGNEAQQAGRQRGAMGYQIEMDARTDVRPDDVLVWLTNGDAELNVREVQKPMLREMDMTIAAETGVVV